MSEKYDLKQSEGAIGQLYPILEAKDGEIIDGFHREEVDKNWKRLRLKHVNSQEKKLIARLVANFHRRQVSREEKEEWINGLARIYEAQGLKVGSKGHRNEIMAKIIDATGLSDRAVGTYLKGEYKQEPPYDVERRQPVIPASARIEHELGKEYVERHRKEVEQELRPRIEKEIRERIIDDEIEPAIREELSRDARFLREAIERAPEVLPNLPDETIERARKVVKPLGKEMGVREGIVYTVGEYECPHCKRHYLIKCDGRKDWLE